MKGVYKYIDAEGRIQITKDTDNIPESATGLITFYPPPIPAPPHTVEDHRLIVEIQDEFDKVFERIYGHPPPRKEHAADQQEG